MAIRTIIADDHTLVRRGIVELISSDADFVVVGEAESGFQILDLLAKTTVDLLILDLEMPGVSGIELVKRLMREWPTLPLLVLSMHDEASLVGRVLEAGVQGYLTKRCAPEVLLHAARKVAKGGCFIDRDLADELLFLGSGNGSKRHQSLSQREMQVLQMIVEGHGVSEIAGIVSLSPKTISTHKTRLMQKLQVTNNADLIRYAIEWKIAGLLHGGSNPV